MSGNGVTIRRANPSDAAEIVAVCHSSWRDAHRDVLPSRLLDLPDQAREERGFSKWLARDDVDGVVAAQAGRVVGFAMLRPYPFETTPVDMGELSTFYVATEDWRRGVGTALWKAVLDCANDRNMTHVLLSVLEGNERARAFFARCGFVPDGESKTGHGPAGERITEIRMVRTLSANKESAAPGMQLDD